MCSMGIEHISGLHKAGTSVWVRRAPCALWSVVRPNCSERKEDTTVQTPDQFTSSGGHGNTGAGIDQAGEQVR